MQPILLTADEASKALGISRSTLYRLTNQGKLNKKAISARRVGWLREEIIAFARDLGPELIKFQSP